MKSRDAPRLAVGSLVFRALLLVALVALRTASTTPSPQCSNNRVVVLTSGCVSPLYCSNVTNLTIDGCRGGGNVTLLTSDTLRSFVVRKSTLGSVTFTLGVAASSSVVINATTITTVTILNTVRTGAGVLIVASSVANLIMSTLVVQRAAVTLSGVVGLLTGRGLVLDGASVTIIGCNWTALTATGAPAVNFQYLVAGNGSSITVSNSVVSSWTLGNRALDFSGAVLVNASFIATDSVWRSSWESVVLPTLRQDGVVSLSNVSVSADSGYTAMTFTSNESDAWSFVRCQFVGVLTIALQRAPTANLHQLLAENSIGAASVTVTSVTCASQYLLNVVTQSLTFDMLLSNVDWTFVNLTAAAVVFERDVVDSSVNISRSTLAGISFATVTIRSSVIAVDSNNVVVNSLNNGALNFRSTTIDNGAIFIIGCLLTASGAPAVNFQRVLIGNGSSITIRNSVLSSWTSGYRAMDFSGAVLVNASLIATDSVWRSLSNSAMLPTLRQDGVVSLSNVSVSAGSGYTAMAFTAIESDAWSFLQCQFVGAIILSLQRAPSANLHQLLVESNVTLASVTLTSATCESQYWSNVVAQSLTFNVPLLRGVQWILYNVTATAMTFASPFVSAEFVCALCNCRTLTLPSTVVGSVITLLQLTSTSGFLTLPSHTLSNMTLTIESSRFVNAVGGHCIGVAASSWTGSSIRIYATDCTIASGTAILLNSSAQFVNSSIVIDHSVLVSLSSSPVVVLPFALGLSGSYSREH